MSQKDTLSFNCTKLSIFCYPGAGITKVHQKPWVPAPTALIFAEERQKIAIFSPIDEEYAKIRNSDS